MSKFGMHGFLYGDLGTRHSKEEAAACMLSA